VAWTPLALASPSCGVNVKTGLLLFLTSTQQNLSTLLSWHPGFIIFLCLRLVFSLYIHISANNSCNLSFSSFFCQLVFFLISKKEFSLSIANLHADIELESCEAEKSILKRRLSQSASEVERWVRISLTKCSSYTNVIPSGQLIQVTSIFVETEVLRVI
jgi:hypothetical protein